MDHQDWKCETPFLITYETDDGKLSGGWEYHSNEREARAAAMQGATQFTKRITIHGHGSTHCTLISEYVL